MTKIATPITRFCGSAIGDWEVLSHQTVCGPAIPAFSRLAITPDSTSATDADWQARGFNSNLRYTSIKERAELLANGAPADRSDRCAVLIPMSKSPIWWGLAQDERLAIYARSGHTGIGMTVLPAVLRRLYHSRDLGEAFDFLTWFEFAPETEPAFEAMLMRLRSSEEWRYVSAETQINLRR
jgi:hypothetical protein